MKRSPFNKCLLLLAGLFLSGTLSVSQAQAGCTNLEYDHNRSRMAVDHCEFGMLKIRYMRPRKGMRRQGARNGTLLFDGFENRNGQISGTARVFSRHCGETTYTVTGIFRNDSAIVLDGRVPILNKNCRVIRHRQDNLLFTLSIQANPVPQPQPFPLPTPPVVLPTCPPGYFFQSGVCQPNSGPVGGGGSPRDFTRNIIGSRWSYPYGGNTYEFTFGNGTIDNFSNGWWPGVTWDIISPNKLELWNPANGKVMSITFLSPNRFRALNWDDNIAVLGKRLGRVTGGGGFGPNGGVGGGTSSRKVRPSFNCAKAGTPTEFAICGNNDLAQLDKDLAISFKRTIREITTPKFGGTRADVRDFRRTQKDWLRQRNRCASNVTCLRRSYKKRQAEIHLMN